MTLFGEKKNLVLKRKLFFFNLGNEKLYFEVERKEHTVFLGQGEKQMEESWR